MRGVLIQVKKLKTGDRIKLGPKVEAVVCLGGHPGRVPADGNRKVVIKTAANDYVRRQNDSIRVLTS